MNIYIEGHKPVHQGAGIAIKLRLENEAAGESARAEIIISFDDYSVLCDYIKSGSISEELFSALEERGRRYAAYSYGMYLLEYGECSRKKMVYKLTQKGHDRESAEAAADMLVKAGYIDEYEQIHSAMLHACNDKCYGRKRIIAELYSNGFERETIREAFRLFEDELDYEEAKRKLLCRKFGSEEPIAEDLKQKQKIMNTLYRYGH